MLIELSPHLGVPNYYYIYPRKGYSCGDSSWVEQYSKAASKELRYGDTATLESWIDEAYKTTMARLMHLMTDKFHLYEHLKALKDYIFLGQGDFIALLM